MRSPTTEGVEYPLPMSVAFQTCLGPSFGHCLRRPVSLEVPALSGPRHCGQSAARPDTGTIRRQMAKTERCRAFILFLSEVESSQLPEVLRENLGAGAMM